MSTPRHRLRRGLLLALVVVVVVAVVGRLRAPVGRRTEFLPSVGGDTWPPVPVKDVGGA